jgi:hypothetical protein
LHQILPILKLRLLNLTRVIAEGGWRAIVLFFVVLAVVIYSIKSLTDHNLTQLNIAVCCLLLFTDRTRKDTPFLFLMKKHGNMLRLIEYALIILSFNSYALWLSAHNLLYPAGDILFAAVMVILPRSKSSGKIPDVIRALTLFLPVQLYELKYGLRQLSLLIAVFWIASFVLSFYGPALPFFIIIISIFFIDHISYKEPIEITQSHQYVANALNHRMFKLATAIFFFFIPQLIISLYLWYSTLFAWIILASFWMAISTISYSLLLRYASHDESYSSLSKNIQVLLFLIATLFPPISFYLLYKQYKYAECSLEPLLK